MIEPKLLLERMPGSFLFFQIAILLVGENLFNILIIQIIVDAINCVVIAFIARTLNKSLFILAGLVSAFSPLMVIVSSQILSDTIFLFFFSFAIYCILNFIKYKRIFNLFRCFIFRLSFVYSCSSASANFFSTNFYFLYQS